MDLETVTRERRERDLLERVRSKRKLPIPSERKRIREQAKVSLRELASEEGLRAGGHDLGGCSPPQAPKDD